MMANLSRRERVLVMTAVVVVVLIGIWQLAIQPIRDRNRQAAELVPVREQLLARRRDLIARKGAILGDLAAAKDQVAKVSETFLTAATPAVAASELQKLVKEMATQAGTEVRSERILTPVEHGDLLEVPVEIAVSGEIRQLVDLLTHLDTSPKLLTIQDLRVRVVNVTQPRELLATVTLSGYIVAGKGKV